MAVLSLESRRALTFVTSWYVHANWIRLTSNVLGATFVKITAFMIDHRKSFWTVTTVISNSILAVFNFRAQVSAIWAFVYVFTISRVSVIKTSSTFCNRLDWDYLCLESYLEKSVPRKTALSQIWPDFGKISRYATARPQPAIRRIITTTQTTRLILLTSIVIISTSIISLAAGIRSCSITKISKFNAYFAILSVSVISLTKYQNLTCSVLIYLIAVVTMVFSTSIRRFLRIKPDHVSSLDNLRVRNFEYSDKTLTDIIKVCCQNQEPKSQAFI